MANEVEDKTELDISKERLAKAFRSLELLIDEKIAAGLDKDGNGNFHELEKKINEVISEKEKLENSYSDIYEKYAYIKLLNLEIVEELNKSIKDIDDILDNNYGNNS